MEKMEKEILALRGQQRMQRWITFLMAAAILALSITQWSHRAQAQSRYREILELNQQIAISQIHLVSNQIDLMEQNDILAQCVEKILSDHQ